MPGTEIELLDGVRYRDGDGVGDGGVRVGVELVSDDCADGLGIGPGIDVDRFEALAPSRRSLRCR